MTTLDLTGAQCFICNDGEPSGTVTIITSRQHGIPVKFNADDNGDYQFLSTPVGRARIAVCQWCTEIQCSFCRKPIPASYCLAELDPSSNCPTSFACPHCFRK